MHQTQSAIPDSQEPAQGFTPQQALVLQSLASGCTPTQAATRAGAHRSQLYRWIVRPAFALALENAQREHYAAVGTRFHAMAVGALDALEQMLDDPECCPEARIKIAGMIFARLERAQPPLPASIAEGEAINRQCHDPHAPHIVVGRAGVDVTDRDAESQPRRQIQTPSEVPAPFESPRVTDPDATCHPLRQILTDSEAPTPAESQGVTDPDAQQTFVRPIPAATEAAARIPVTDPDARSSIFLRSRRWFHSATTATVRSLWPTAIPRPSCTSHWVAT